MMQKRYDLPRLLEGVQRRLDLNLLLICLFLVPAFHPLLSSTLTLSSDGLVHLYRLVALDHAIDQGLLFPRWMPDLTFGYGLPLFVYYPPLSYYIAELLHILGLQAVFAMNASLALSLLVGAWAMYLLVRDLFNPMAGLVASIAYAYAPFQLLNLYARGSPPTAWGMAFFPLVLWAFRRLIRAQDNILAHLLPGALAVGALFLSHNITTLIFGPLLGGYLLILLWSKGSYQRVVSAGLSLALGASLALFFLLPAMAERPLVQLKRLITPPGFDYHFHFLALSDLLSLPPRANTGYLNPETPLSIGLPQLGLALLGLGLAGVYKSRERRGMILFSGLALVTSIFMLLPASVGVWDRLPLLAFVQRPSRLLSLPTFLMAVLTGSLLGIFHTRVRDKRLASPAFVLTVVSLLVIIGASLPLLYPRYYDLASADPTLLDMMDYERTSGTIGTTSFGEYLPIWVRQAPNDSPLELLYRSGAPLDRLDESYLPAGARVTSANYGGNRAELTIISPEATQLVFHTFYFPGWRAIVNGEEVDTFPVTERGLLGLVIPKGESRVQISFSETSIRLTADTLSALGVFISLILVMAVLYRKWNERKSAECFERDEAKVVHPSSGGMFSSVVQNAELDSLQKDVALGRISTSWQQVVALVVLALALTLTKSLYLDRSSNPFKLQFSGLQDVSLGVRLNANFGDQIVLLGYDLPHSTVVAGEPLDVVLYWQAHQQPSTSYSSMAQLIDSKGNVVSAQDNLHPGQYPTISWQPWGYVTDPHSVPVPIETPSGHYMLLVGLYDPDTWHRLPIVNPDSPEWADAVLIGPLTVISE
jgi:hypothetical protein